MTAPTSDEGTTPRRSLWPPSGHAREQWPYSREQAAAYNGFEVWMRGVLRDRAAAIEAVEHTARQIGAATGGRVDDLLRDYSDSHSDLSGLEELRTVALLARHLPGLEPAIFALLKHVRAVAIGDEASCCEPAR
jgi:hypothetical protein